MTDTYNVQLRHRLQTDREGCVVKGTVGTGAGDIDFYVTVNFFPDKTPGEVFVVIAKCGSDLQGWVRAWAIAISIALQHGVPWEALADKFLNESFGMCIGTPSILHSITEKITDAVGRVKAGELKIGRGE